MRTPRLTKQPQSAQRISIACEPNPAPRTSAVAGRCWRMVYGKAAGHGGHCMEPVAWVGRSKFLTGWTKVWSCDQHTDELQGARRTPGG
jgi:hypothetical protein